MTDSSLRSACSLEQVYERLEKVENGIVVSEIWLTRQRCLIERLGNQRVDVTRDEDVFRQMEQVLGEWHELRQWLLDRIARVAH